MGLSKERLLDIASDLLARFLIGFGVAAFLFIGVVSLRIGRYSFLAGVSTWERFLACVAIAFVYALIGLRKGPGAI